MSPQWNSIHEQDMFFRQQKELSRVAERRRLGLSPQAIVGTFLPASSAAVPVEKPSLAKSLEKFGHITIDEFNVKHGVRRKSEL